MNYKFLSVDFQNEFADKNGKFFNGGKSIDFIQKTLIPFLQKNNIKVCEIISDYRLPRKKSSSAGCIPGEFGFQSALPENVRDVSPWIKCMNSPIWIRKNIGKKDKKAGIPYQDAKKFNKWLKSHFGQPSEDLTIILFGLTLDCCVLSVAQELYWHGYRFKILIEATDVMPNKNQEEVKRQLVGGQVLNHWLKFIKFEDLIKDFK